MVGCKIILGFDSWSGFGLDKDSIWATTYEFTQCGVLTSVYSDKHVQPPLKLRGSKWCLVSSLVFIEYSIGQQRLWSKNFCQGEGGGLQAWLFFSSQLVSQFYRGCPMVISNQTIIFQGFRGGPTFFRGGGVQHIPGGGGGQNANFYRNPYNVIFWEEVRTPIPLLDPHTSFAIIFSFKISSLSLYEVYQYLLLLC